MKIIKLFKYSPLHAIFLLLFGAQLSSCASQSIQRATATTSTNVYAEFIPHTEPGPFGSYLAMNLKFERYAEFRQQIEAKINKQLKHRGEAHITVITPPEYQSIKDFITIKEINDIALAKQIQSSAFTEICIGRGAKNDMQTFYVVVESEALLSIRKEIEKLVVLRGGSNTNFMAGNFFPHITLGFTHRDLHFEDGIVKDKKTCINN